MKIFFVFLFCIVLGVFAQEQQEKKEATQKDVDVKNDTDQKEAPLPKISLPEFVITGNEEIHLDIKSKKEKDEERVFIPDEKTPGSRLMELEGVLSPKLIKPFTKTPTGLNGKLFAGFGFYQTPQIDGWFGQYDQTNSFVVNGYYSSSEGHVKNAGGWKSGAGARAKYVMPESSLVLPHMQVSGNVNYGRESYYAFASSLPAQVRDISQFDMYFGAASRYVLPYKSLNGFDYSGKVGLRSFSLSDSVSSSESEFSLNGIATGRLLTVDLRGQIDYRSTGYNYSMNLPGIHSGQWFTLKGEMQTSLFPSLLMSLSVQQFFYRGNVKAAGGRLYPQIDFHYYMTENASMTAGFSPAVERNTLESIVKQNKYVDNSVALLHSDLPVNVYAGFDVSPVDELTATLKFSYKRIKNYPTFLDVTGAKVWKVDYLPDVRATKIDAAVVYRLNALQNITAYVLSQIVKQKDSASFVPYVPAYSFGAVYHHTFVFGLHAEALAEYVAPRYIDATNSRKNAGYLYTSVKGEMELFEKFYGIVELQNAFNREYYIWDGYKERTVFLSLGISYHW